MVRRNVLPLLWLTTAVLNIMLSECLARIMVVVMCMQSNGLGTQLCQLNCQWRSPGFDGQNQNVGVCKFRVYTWGFIKRKWNSIQNTCNTLNHSGVVDRIGLFVTRVISWPEATKLTTTQKQGCGFWFLIEWKLTTLHNVHFHNWMLFIQENC